MTWAHAVVITAVVFGFIGFWIGHAEGRIAESKRLRKSMYGVLAR